MATSSDTTAHDPTKDCAAAHTPVSRAFNNLLAQLESFVAHEQSVDAPGIDVMSESFRKGLADAEAAREALFEAVGETLTAPDRRPQDRGLRRLAHVLYVMLTMEDDGDRQHFYASTVRHRDIFAIDGQSPAARLTRRLSASFFCHFDDLAGLREFGGDGPVASPERDFAPVPA
jgi:hypothetical protein